MPQRKQFAKLELSQRYQSFSLPPAPFTDMVLLCSSGWPRIFVPSAFTSNRLGLQACTNVPDWAIAFGLLHCVLDIHFLQAPEHTRCLPIQAGPSGWV